MTATTTTMSGPTSARRGPALWAGLALFLGGAIGASVATVVVDDNTSNPSAVSTSVEGSFRSASASEAERYVDSLESRASSIGATEHGYVYAHGSSAAPQTSSRMSADAAEHWAESEQSSLDSCHGATHGVC